jgi:two-component system response regulator HydG
MSPRVLLVDDDRPLCETLALGLRRRRFDVTFRTSAEPALEALDVADYDVIVTDLNMGGIGGIELCERIVANRPEVPVVVLTAFGSMDAAVAAIRAGAYDFINKPVEIEALAIAVDRAATHRSLREELKRLRLETGRLPRFDQLIGESPAMQEAYDLIERVAASDAAVLITGESGTGKEDSSPSTAPRCRRPCWRASSLVTGREPSPMRRTRRWVSSAGRTGGPSCSTR